MIAMADVPKQEAKAEGVPSNPAPEEQASPQQPEQTSAEAKKAPRKRVAKPKASADAPAVQSQSTGGVMLFNKYGYDVEVRDLSLKNYINLTPVIYPETFRRESQKRLSKARINIVERLANDMMRGGTGGKIGGKVIRTKGRLQGKKTTAISIIEEAFGAVQQQTGKNPVQVLVYALENSAPIEDTTRVRYGGIISNIPVDISASRRLDIALRNISMAAMIGAFNNKRSVADTLANELILAAKNDVNSYAIKRKNEIERMARSAK